MSERQYTESLSENLKLLEKRAFHRKNNHPVALLGSPQAAPGQSFRAPFGWRAAGALSQPERKPRRSMG